MCSCKRSWRGVSIPFPNASFFKFHFPASKCYSSVVHTSASALFSLLGWSRLSKTTQRCGEDLQSCRKTIGIFWKVPKLWKHWRYSILTSRTSSLRPLRIPECLILLGLEGHHLREFGGDLFVWNYYYAFQRWIQIDWFNFTNVYRRSTRPVHHVILSNISLAAYLIRSLLTASSTDEQK